MSLCDCWAPTRRQSIRALFQILLPFLVILFLLLSEQLFCCRFAHANCQLGADLWTVKRDDDFCEIFAIIISTIGRGRRRICFYCVRARKKDHDYGWLPLVRRAAADRPARWLAGWLAGWAEGGGREKDFLPPSTSNSAALRGQAADHGGHSRAARRRPLEKPWPSRSREEQVGLLLLQPPPLLLPLLLRCRIRANERHSNKKEEEEAARRIPRRKPPRHHDGRWTRELACRPAACGCASRPKKINESRSGLLYLAERSR